ncbi:type II secretion system protein [Desulfovibrio sp. TomC]|uniref:type II secretion system protein n=1 Tax=Desulfovibrio sp. TomC TaxID=1562888 RepID=UPI0005B9C16B|nr:type II secretion system protein [Desulfovibrio sp. TomC]
MKAKGFTLLELIMTIVLFGIVSVMVVSFFNPATTRSDIPVKQLQVDAQLQLALENMIAEKNTSTYVSNLNALQTSIGSGNQSTYGGGTNYYVLENRFVCLNGTNTFVNSSVNQYLLVTIAPTATSGSRLSYLFSSNAGNCLAGGS